MSLSNLSSSQLAQLIRLIKVKESLQTKLDRVDSALQSLEGGHSVPKKRGRKPDSPPGVKKGPKKGKAGKKGRGKRLKEPLLNLLKGAGADGITVKELSSKLKVKPSNIFSWFYTTGKKIKGINKVGEAKYAYSA